MERFEKKYFDWKFENSVLDDRRYDGDAPWYGLWKDEVLIIGRPSDDESGTWYYNGEYFFGGTDFLGYEPRGFANLIKHYLNKKLPQENIKEVL